MVEKRNNLEFGAAYEDAYSGFTGTATGYCFYVTGCDNVLLTHFDPEGGEHVSKWIDVARVRRLAQALITLPDEIQDADSVEEVVPVEPVESVAEVEVDPRWAIPRVVPSRLYSGGGDLPSVR